MLDQLDKEKKYVVFQPLDNNDVQRTVKLWLEEAGGSMPLDEIEKKFDENFHFFYAQTYSEEEFSENSPINSWRKFAFKVENNIVYGE